MKDLGTEESYWSQIRTFTVKGKVDPYVGTPSSFATLDLLES